MYLPQELKVRALGHLEKIDLKAVRLVDKLWSSCASYFLFDKIYWSFHDLDQEVFGHIVSDPALASYVRILEIDRSQFDHNLSKHRYFEDFCLQINTIAAYEKWNDGSPNGEGPVSDILQGIDPQILALARKANLADTNAVDDDLWKDFGNLSFVNEGYSKYMFYARRQQQVLHNTTAFEKFCAGLARLGNLQSFIVSPCWCHSPLIRSHDKMSSLPGSSRSDDGVCKTIMISSKGSPLARSWNTFHTKPSMWIPRVVKGESGIGIDIGFGEAHLFLHMSRVLLACAKQPRELIVGQEIPWMFADACETGPVGCPPLFSWYERFLDTSEILNGAFRELTHIILHFVLFEGIHMPLAVSFRGLGRFLEPLKSLRSLDLVLPGEMDHSPLYTYDQVFSATAGMWPHLQDLSLQNIVVITRDFLRLLRGSPSLRGLKLLNIVLLDGQWEWIMEYLHAHMQLEELIVMTICDCEGLAYGLRYPVGTAAYGEGLGEYIPKVEQYVTRQGPRPKLHADEPDGMAQRYLDELKRFL